MIHELEMVSGCAAGKVLGVFCVPLPYISVTAPLGLNESSTSGKNSVLSDLSSFNSLRNTISRGTWPLFPFRVTWSPNQSANFCYGISGVENVRERVDMYSSVAALPLKIFIKLVMYSPQF